MVTSTQTDAAAARSDDPQSVSDETTERVLRLVLLGLAIAVLIGGFAVAAIWALSADDEPPPPMNAVDVGFLQDMIDHHEQALVISDAYLDHNAEGEAGPYAREVILYQTRDLGWMRDWLAEEGYEPGAPDRLAMEWLGEPTPVAEMPGMQTPERIQELRDARGADADRLFFEIMTDHHLGGVHMADHAAANGARPDIVEFAEAVARNQRIETNEFRLAMERLGLT
jgi:uncharacterized protein (DUF305 family)